MKVALGFAPHSGWAAVVGLEQIGGALRVRLRRRVDLADPADAQARQPYHAVEGRPVPEAARRLASWQRQATARALRALEGISRELTASGAYASLCGIGILESSGRTARSLEATLASHALIHTADGNHFREALAAAAERRGLAVVRIRAQALRAEAVAAAGQPGEALDAELRRLGRAEGPPWGADQKAAALLAWIVLAGGPGARTH